MKNLLKASVLFALLITTAQLSAQKWGSKKIKGNGNVTTETTQTGDYSRIAAVGPMDVFLEKGSEGSITVEADSNFHEYIEIKTEGSKLVLKVKKGYNLSSRNPIKVTVPFTDIEKLDLTGSGDVETRDAIEASNFEGNLTGSGDIKMEVNSNQAIFRITGSGDMMLKGSSDSAEIKISGSGDFDGRQFKTKDAETYISGSGDVKVYATNTLKARVNGSGDITYGGNPTVDKKVSGSGSVESRN